MIKKICKQKTKKKVATLMTEKKALKKKTTNKDKGRHF